MHAPAITRPPRTCPRAPSPRSINVALPSSAPRPPPSRPADGAGGSQWRWQALAPWHSAWGDCLPPRPRIRRLTSDETPATGDAFDALDALDTLTLTALDEDFDFFLWLATHEASLLAME